MKALIPECQVGNFQVCYFIITDILWRTYWKRSKWILKLIDICIAQALSSSSCMISSECMSLITCNDASKGYHKTHQYVSKLFIAHITLILFTSRILFALMLRGRCRESRLMHNISMRVILANLCSSVLNELRWVAFLQYPAFLRDLIVEQSKSRWECRLSSHWSALVLALFCSLAGFTEFYNQHLIADILSWQTKLGCFTTIDIANVNSCSGHLSGLAISYLGLLMKHCYMWKVITRQSTSICTRNNENFDRSFNLDIAYLF